MQVDSDILKQFRASFLIIKENTFTLHEEGKLETLSKVPSFSGSKNHNVILYMVKL